MRPAIAVAELIAYSSPIINVTGRGAKRQKKIEYSFAHGTSSLVSSVCADEDNIRRER